MRIIHTHEDYNDYSGSRTLKLLSEELVRRGHEVSVFTSGGERLSETVNGVAVERFPLSGNRVRGIQGDRTYVEEYKKLLQDSNTDVVLNYAAQSWTTDVAFGALDAITAKKILVPCGYSRLHSVRYKKYFQELPEYLKKYDHIVYLSHAYQDKGFADKKGIHNGVPCSVIPNAADEAEFGAPHADFKKKYSVTTPYLVLSVGNHYFAKNHPLIFRVARALKRRDVTFAIVGKPHSAAWRGCQLFCRLSGKLLGSVRIFDKLERSDVVAAYHGADIVLHTSSVECDPIVMYEAFASKTPMVATSVGSIPEFEDFIIIQKSSRALAEAVDYLLRDERERSIRAERAHALWKEKYTLSKMVDAYEKLYLYF